MLPVLRTQNYQKFLLVKLELVRLYLRVLRLMPGILHTQKLPSGFIQLHFIYSFFFFSKKVPSTCHEQ